MSEQQLKDFAEVAEQREPVPDLDSHASRGRDLRRQRMAAPTAARSWMASQLSALMSSFSH